MAELFGGHDASEGLTPIHLRIHCAATPDKVEEAQVEAFVNTLAEVALAVAKRSVVGGAAEGGSAA